MLTECALPCRLARMGQSRVVSTDQGIRAGISAGTSAGRGFVAGAEVGGYFCPDLNILSASMHRVAVVAET